MRSTPFADRDDQHTLDALAVTRRVCGEGVADRLWKVFAGKELYFPVRPGPEHPISKAIGHGNALLLAGELGRTRHRVPSADQAERHEVVRWGVFAGVGAAAMASLTGYSRAHIHYVIESLTMAGALPRRWTDKGGAGPGATEQPAGGNRIGGGTRDQRRDVVRWCLLAGISRGRASDLSGYTIGHVYAVAASLRKAGLLPPSSKGAVHA